VSDRHFFASVARISDLSERAFDVEPLRREDWGTGDYVSVEILSDASGQRIELENGRMIEVAEGDLVVGALGRRSATLEATGSWEAVEEDGRMSVLTSGGLLGRCTSRSMVLPPLTAVRYRGHVTLDAEPARMRDFVEPFPPRAYEVPTVLLVGTSMSAGKTTAARIVIRQLEGAGRKVVAAKLTGAGRYRDVLSMKDAGAEAIFDFVDVGLPSTVCPEETYRPALEELLARIAATEADVAVIEAGASPLEPYNGAAAVAAIRQAVRCTILAASDPYAVVGVISAFGMEPDLVTGVATNTIAGIRLTEKLSGVPALNVRDRDSLPDLRALLRRALYGV